MRTCGPMDKAPAYGAGDSRFDPWHVHFYFIYKIIIKVVQNSSCALIMGKQREQ
jgi:hypothetical protein